ncbi:hypothetical protein HAX54_051305 [Datura stramonium]|uniref:Uncharacterized protein n=1 Tax=Datura stramonium TaxID=4076 RepID=A0ABS8SXG1_DATST|nr:hypothetical protein [Datura stramonium]
MKLMLMVLNLCEIELRPVIWQLRELHARGKRRGSQPEFDSSGRDWDSGRDFESYGGVADYRFRPKRRAAVGESEVNVMMDQMAISFEGNTSLPQCREEVSLECGLNLLFVPYRSPGPWLSPRRVNEGYNGLPDSSHHRSAAMYREDRMRSMVIRRSLSSRRSPPVGENDNFRFHPNAGPRPFRFYQEADAEFVERSNTREREFDDNNIKDRPLPRRMRNVEEQEGGNFRQSGQLWHEERI